METEWESGFCNAYSLKKKSPGTKANPKQTLAKYPVYFCGQVGCIIHSHHVASSVQDGRQSGMRNYRYFRC